MSLRRIGILGGTFDPIHWGHLETAAAAQSALDLSDVHILPASLPWHRHPPVASSFHRFAMVSLAVAGRRGWCADDLELIEHTQSYTSDTLRAFHQRGCAPGELFFILGADAFVAIATWKHYPTLLEYAHFVVVSRPGCPVGDLPRLLPELSERMTAPPLDANLAPRIVLIDAVTPDVSATDIRERRLRHESIAGLVPEPVREHIEQHGLYTSPTVVRRAGASESPTAAGRIHGQD